jgi:activator of 2-hydroxyglutaryl-CoA dehydratase/predicted nucleotide-binding protein (sugar kinase/HSP70/actin superfamily)
MKSRELTMFDLSQANGPAAGRITPHPAAPASTAEPSRPALPTPAPPMLPHGCDGGVFIDAGVAHARILACAADGAAVVDTLVPAGDLRATLLAWRDTGSAAPVFVTGKLAPLTRETLGRGTVIAPAAAAWLAARDWLAADADPAVRTLAVVELSASGYLVIGVDRSGALHDELLVVNPRCGAGSGINLDRVLGKLALARGDVDAILADYAGAAGAKRRAQVTVRADRCGVFASSATISDKNQGIPLDVALATTLKSEVLKACRKLPAGFDRVVLTGRVFRWRFARECAQDWLQAQGVERLVFDPDNTGLLDALRAFVRRTGADGLSVPQPQLLRPRAPATYPAMAQLKARYEASHRYLRLAETPLPERLQVHGRSLHLALDVGSTMAKAVLTDAGSGETLWLAAASNAGDTIDTIKRILRDLVAAGGGELPLAGVGITGSARYQVQQALENIYPELAGRVFVLVENYAHARGSIGLAREHIARLQAAGVEVDAEFCILVDIGGEDTKISTIALGPAELYGNAMNLKCSAGTGSLMDTLAAMFGIGDVAGACAAAFAAPGAQHINATCAVFLMENARKLQLQGAPCAEILAAANWAIVENMARSLWNQLELPPRTVVLLHGQTMRSEPLPVAVTHRLQSYLGAPVYALVPPWPGHRACFGLAGTLRQTAPSGSVPVGLARFLEARFDKRIIQCHGAACDDKAACCNRASLTCRDAEGRKLVKFTLGGCSAINELLAKKKNKDAADLRLSGEVRDTYKELWDFIDGRLPRSEDRQRIVIPRSFAVTEWAYLLARLFERLGLPVHVDTVREADLLAAQPLFNVDTCAPHMGAVGQFRRLAGEPHGVILAPQIDFAPTGGVSLGRTCTVNQGGIGVAVNLARLDFPRANFHLFSVDLSQPEAEALRVQLQERLAPLFARYGIAPSADELRRVLADALDDHRRLRGEAADLAASMAEEALAAGTRIAVVVGREYILNPGIYDSHVRRLLRDKHMVVLPSYVLDVELNADYAHIYWRNPHAFVSLLDAVARRELHLKLRHDGLREAFRKIEQGPELLPVVQVSTFCCGPDSVVQPFIAEIMRSRPFLLIQSDAVIKELAHLENRVNTYVKQLDLGVRRQANGGTQPPFEMRTLDALVHGGPIDRRRDLIYLPTLGDNRALSSVLRGAGYACVDSYDDGDYDLAALVRAGRSVVGDAVCTPMAAVYGDLQRAAHDFARRQRAGAAAGQRLLFFEYKGTGPCRQGQYADAHRLLFDRSGASAGATTDDEACPALPARGTLQFLLGLETEGCDIGIEPWVLARAYQGAILHGVLQSLYFAGGERCRDLAEFERFESEFTALKTQLYGALERFHGPGPLARGLLARFGASGVGPLLKYFAWRLNGADLTATLKRFAVRWIAARPALPADVRIALTGEVYMRAAQAEPIFRLLLAQLGFGRFTLEYTPVWSYLEYLLDYEIDCQRERLALASARADGGTDAGRRAAAERLAATTRLRRLLRHWVARPLYRAAALPLPLDAGAAAAMTRELLPTLRPAGELVTYVGEAIGALRHGADVVFNVAPSSCMVATMGEVLTPAIVAAAATGGRVQHLFSADGTVDDELLQLALLKALGPERYGGVATAGCHPKVAR